MLPMSNIKRKPDKCSITGALLEAAMRRDLNAQKWAAQTLKGKDEPIDLYAVAWSDSAPQQLIGEVEERYERKIKELKKQHDQVEEEFEKARDQWRGERRTLHTEVEELNESLKVAVRLRAINYPRTFRPSFDFGLTKSQNHAINWSRIWLLP